jgi:hypothetical protein
MKPRLPSFPTPELTRINYGEGFVAERLLVLKKARQISTEQSMEASDNYKTDHDIKAKPHNLMEGDYAYLDNQLFLGKNKKFAQLWIGPYLVTQVINNQNIELQISPKKQQIHSAYCVKKFISPETSKFLDKKDDREKHGREHRH